MLGTSAMKELGIIAKNQFRKNMPKYLINHNETFGLSYNF